MIVVNESTRNATETLNDIFKILWSNGLVHSQVLIQDEFGLWSLYNFLPYQTNCFSLDHIKIATFSAHNSTHHINLSMEQLFPQKLKDFHKCPIFVAVAMSMPFVMHQNRSATEMVQYVGIDIEIIEQMSKSLNFVTSYIRSSDGTENGFLFPNGTITGSLKLVRASFKHFYQFLMNI